VHEEKLNPAMQQQQQHEAEHSLVDVQAGPHEGLLSAMGQAYQQQQVRACTSLSTVRQP
jgi:hypothetical protein